MFLFVKDFIREHANLAHITNSVFFNPLTAATSLYDKRFRVLNTTINIKDIL
jgi:hypothetical protein